MSLQTGGSIGARRGKFYEFYLKNLLKEKGFFLDSSNSKTEDNIYYFTYRVPDEEITEIDFHFPHKKVGFWVTNLGLTQKIRCQKCSASQKYNEFLNISGTCPHCKKCKLPDLKKEGYSCWICNNCNRICDPFDLEEKICGRYMPKAKQKCNSSNFETYRDTSASSQAHKQVYYRTGELLEVKTSEKHDTLCSEIIFNKKNEWRVWGQVLEIFFDSTLFVFENNPEKFGSDVFDKNVWKFINDNLSGNYPSNPFPKSIIAHVNETRTKKNKNLGVWLKEIEKGRKKYWGEKTPFAFPIRYSIFTVLKSLGKQNNVDPYEIGVLQYSSMGKPITSSKMMQAQKRCEQNGYIKNGNLTSAGKQQIEFAIQEYQKIINIVKNYSGKIHPNDLWLRRKRDLVVSVLEKLLKLSIKNGWYKFAMVAAADVKELDGTPFINTQFEPLETLTSIFLDDFKKNGIIQEYEGLESGDVFEETFLREFFSINQSSTAYTIGDDAKIKLPNGKIVYVQDKSNTSFKKWFETGEIYGSGISYKDFKRMIGHNVLASFKYKNNELIYDQNRYYVGIIDGGWASTRSDLFRMIKSMYTLGVNEVFFADEIDTRFKEYLIDIGQN